MILAVYVTFRFKVSPVSSQIENYTESKIVVVIDPGHGGSDPGKVGINDALEKDINLAIAMKLKELLENEGYEVVLTRKDNNGLYKDSDTNKKVADMKKRCEIIENAEADIVVSIHQNSYTNESVSGAQVFYYKNSQEGKKLAAAIQEALKNYLDEDNNRVEKANDSYYMLLHTPCPTVIVECGFLSNYEEAQALITEDYQQKVAQAIMMGIEEYFR